MAFVIYLKKNRGMYRTVGQQSWYKPNREFVYRYSPTAYTCIIGDTLYCILRRIREISDTGIGTTLGYTQTELVCLAVLYSFLCWTVEARFVCVCVNIVPVSLIPCVVNVTVSPPQCAPLAGSPAMIPSFPTSRRAKSSSPSSDVPHLSSDRTIALKCRFLSSSCFYPRTKSTCIITDRVKPNSSG
jgi:hypothetical protein